MEHLYIGKYIKRDRIPEALHHARLKGHLKGVEDRALRSFLEGFDEVIAERHGKFKDRIDYHEMQEIFKIMGRDHSDYVNDRELEEISEILLDENFQF